MTARAAETTCKSQASSTSTASADQKLKQRPVVDLPRMEMPPSSSSQGRSQRPRTNTPVERASPQVTETVPMDVDSQEAPSTSQGSGAGTAVRPKENRASASHAQAQSYGQRKHADQKAKQRATDQQGVRTIVANVLERQGVELEDWERSQGTNYRVDPLRPPTWVVCPPPGRHLATLEGVQEDEWRAEPDITPEELLRRLTTMARGTSQACSHRSQELYFLMIQVFKETIKNYEDEQGIQYSENAINMDRDLVGPLIATFVHLQRELQVSRDSRQLAWDREVDAKVQRREAESREAQLKCDLEASQDEVFRAQETAREHEKKYHETLVLLKRAQAVDPATATAEDQAHIQSLETQLDDAIQQLDQLRAEHAPGVVDGLIAGHPSETDEQLEALRTENAVTHRALEEITADRDNLRKAHVQLRTEMLTEKAKQDTASSALEVKCLQAEAEVIELREKVATLERRGGYNVPPPTASATAGSHPQPAFGGRGSGLVAQVSPQPGRVMGGPTTQAPSSMGRGMRGMSGLAARQLLTPPSIGRGLLGRFARSGTGSLSSTPTPSPETGSGLGALAPGQSLGAPAANAGKAQGPGSAMNVDEADHAPETSTVRTGDSSTTTDQGPAQTGPHHLPQ